MAEHTKLPWQVSEVRTTEGTAMIVGGAGSEFGLIADVTKDDDAAFIVKACGSHYELTDALSDALNMLRAAHMQLGVHHEGNKRVIKARAVLAKAKASTAAPTPLKERKP